MHTKPEALHDVLFREIVNRCMVGKTDNSITPPYNMEHLAFTT